MAHIDLLSFWYMGSSQDKGPFLGTLTSVCRNII